MSVHAFVRFLTIDVFKQSAFPSFVIACCFLNLLGTISLLTAQQRTETNPGKLPEQSMKLVRGLVVDQNQKPVAAVKVKIPLLGRFEVTSTDENGQFSHYVPSDSLYDFLIVATTEDGKHQGILSFDKRAKNSDATKLVLKLTPARKLRIKVNASNGMVASKAYVGVVSGNHLVHIGRTSSNGLARLQVPQKIDNPLLFAFSSESGFDYGDLPAVDSGIPSDKSDEPSEKSDPPNEPFELTLAKARPVEVQVNDVDGNPLRDVPVLVNATKKPNLKRAFRFSCIRDLVAARSDTQGKVSFDWLPDWKQTLGFSAVSPRLTSYSGRWSPDAGDRPVWMTVFRKFPVRGVVRKDDGTPAGGFKMRFHGSTSVANTRRSSFVAAEAITDDQGKFEVLLTHSHFYLGFSQDPVLKFSKPVGLYFTDKEDVKEQKWTVRAGTKIYGRVTVKKTGEVVANQNVTLTQFEAKVIVQPGGSKLYRAQPAYMRMARTDKQGRYEFLVGAGKYLIQDSNQNKPKSFKIVDEQQQEFNFELRRLEKGILTGKVIDDATGKPVANAKIHGVYSDELAKSGRFMTDADKAGRFKVEVETVSAVLMARSEDSKWAAITKLDPDTKEITLRLKRTIAADGQLVDEKGNPLANQDLIFGRDVRRGSKRNSSFSISFGGLVQTDDQGKFRLEHLVPGTKYQIRFVTEKEDGIPMSYRMVSEAMPEIGSAKLDLGKVTYRALVPYRPPTIEERIATSFNTKTEISNRLKSAMEITRFNRQNLMLVMADPSDARIKQLFKWKYEDQEVKKLLFGFVMLGFQYDRETAPNSLAAISKVTGVKLDNMKHDPLVIFLDKSGKLIQELRLSDLAEDKEGEIDKSNLIRILTELTPQPLDGKKLLADALSLAKKENKRVIVQETATWCGPCIRLSRFLDRTKGDWSKDYIWIKMDHRWNNAIEIMREMRDSAPGGVPWYAILDASGKILVTSNEEESEDNIGYPGDDQTSRTHFKKMFMKSKIRMTDGQVDAWVQKMGKVK